MKQTLSILIVDDHPGMCDTLKDILEDEDYQVSTAESGQEAIDLCQDQTFDVILMDVRMPGLNGVEAFRRIKTFSEGTRVIMMSAYSVEELKREALKEGAVAFLQKPLDIEMLLKLIQQTEHPPVLIVMNDQQERETVADYLIQSQYRAYTTSTATEAIELARQIRFSIIMIDTNLTSTRGLDLYLTLKQITPTSATIMLAETDEHFLAQAAEAVRQNAYTFLKKPLDIDQLLSILEQLQRQQHSDLVEKPEENNEGNT